MLDLSGLLPLLGAGAQGYMQGQQQADAHNQIKQLMAMREAEEMRSSQLHPLQMQSQQQQITQNRAMFPLQRDAAIGNNLQQTLQNDLQTRLQSPVSPAISGMLGQEFPNRNFGNMSEDQAMSMANLLRPIRVAKEATDRKKTPDGNTTRADEQRMLRLYFDTVKLGTPKEMFDYMMQNEPEIANAIAADPSVKSREAFASALRAQIKERYGYDVGAAAPQGSASRLMNNAAKAFGPVPAGGR